MEFLKIVNAGVSCAGADQVAVGAFSQFDHSRAPGLVSPDDCRQTVCDDNRRAAVGKLSSDWRSANSVSLSKAEVGSSRSRIGASFRNARAMESRCRWPPDQTGAQFTNGRVVALRQAGNEVVDLCDCAASTMSSMDRSGVPATRFSLIVP